MNDKIATALDVVPLEKNLNPTSSPIRVESTDKVNVGITPEEFKVNF